MSNWYEDSILLFEENEDLLEQIKQIEIDSVGNSDKLRRAQPKIKNFLENCRSPLDYLSVYLRDTYTNNRQRVYFPIAYNQESFKMRIRSDFKNKLPQNILIAISKVLPFYGQTQSLGWLVKLTNENKHQGLSLKKQILEQTVHHLHIPGQVTISNVRMISSKAPISIAGTEYDLIDNFPNNSSDVSNRYILIFKEFDLEVVSLLTEILTNTKKVVEDVNLIVKD